MMRALHSEDRIEVRKMRKTQKTAAEYADYAVVTFYIRIDRSRFQIYIDYSYRFQRPVGNAVNGCPASTIEVSDVFSKVVYPDPKKRVVKAELSILPVSKQSL
mgnify:CR=1 FL=1